MPEVKSAKDLREHMPQTAFAFRGYNVTNLGRTRELLEHPVYGGVVQRHLRLGSQVCADLVHRTVDLEVRIREGRDTDLDSYDEAIALIMAVEIAQLKLLEEFFNIQYSRARMAIGFSLGEIAALVAGGVFALEDAMRIPIQLAADSAALAHDVTLGVLFSRGKQLSVERVHRLCMEINLEGRGVVGVSAILSPNSVLLMGQQDTLARLTPHIKSLGDGRTYLRPNEHRWPPLHSPVIWQRQISDRARHLLHTIPGGFRAPVPPVLSLVTGQLSYTETNTRELLGYWVDHPQRLWSAVEQTLALGIETLIHVGPEPNIVPATFRRLALDVEAQIKTSIGVRALSGIVRRPWLQSLLPRQAALLRATSLQQITLEDWLLEQHVR